MISLCITGLSHSAIAAAERALVAAGMAAAGPAQRDTSITFASWHNRMHEAMAQGATSQIAEGAPVSIGRLWEQLASDLFLSNMQEPVWGWADAKSLGLLDYWLGFDPSTHFVLLATSPEQMLAEHLASLSRDSELRATELLVDGLMAQWRDAHQLMLRFALLNPSRCIFVQADEMPLPALVQTVQAAWPRHLGTLQSDLVTSPKTSVAANGDPARHLLLHFAQEMFASYPQMHALKHEVESVALALSETTLRNAPSPVLGSVLATVALADQVPVLIEKIAKLQLDIEFEKSGGASALSTLAASSKFQLLAFEESLGKELQKKVDALAQRDQEAQAKAQALSKGETLAQEKAELLASLQEQQRAKDEALAQCEQETKTKFALEVQRDALAVSVDALEVKSNRLETLLCSVEEENRLLLAQLSQVQNELERYFLRNKEIAASADQWGLRFRRVMSRQVDAIDWESTRAEPTQGPNGMHFRCYASQVAVIGKEWDALEFTARIRAGSMEYHFDRRPGEVGLFTRWPLSAAKANQLIVTDGLNLASGDCEGLLQEISTSDWDLLLGLPKLLGHALGQLKGPWPQGMPKLKAWYEAANATVRALHRQPIALRFDTTWLLASKVLADREYLLLRVDQLSLAGKRLTSFEFRFGCSLGKMGEFGQNARLEFVKGSTETAFETWVPNIRDLEGERLDLVFVFPSSMNLKDWTALSTNDRGLVLLLADQLPAILGALVLGNVCIARPLGQWIELAKKLRIFVRTRLDVTGVQQVMPDTVTGDLKLLSKDSVTPHPSNRKTKVSSGKSAVKALPKKSARVVAEVGKV